MQKVWFITGVSSGFGYELAKQLLEKKEIVVGTVRNKSKVSDLIEKYPDNFDVMTLDITNHEEIPKVVEEAINKYGKIDVLISNAGYGLFGAIEEINSNQIEDIVNTNLLGSIYLIKSVIPYMRKARSGRIIQISSYGGQVAFAGNSMYHATKFGIEGFCESVAQELAPFGIGLTIVEPGGARTEFRYGSAKVASLMKEYDGNPAHDFMKMLDKKNGLAPGDPALMATRIIESVDKSPASLRLVLGSQALKSTIDCLEKRLADYKTQEDLAKSTDIKE